MDNKTRKRIQVLKNRLQNPRNRRLSARQQPDDADEREQVEREIVALDEELR